MRNPEQADIYHCLAQRWFDNTISHADDEQKEKGKGISAGIQYGYQNHQRFVEGIVAITILIVIEAPGHKLFHNEEDDGSCDIILYRQDIGPMLDVQKCPECSKHGICNRETTVERKLGNLSRRKLAVCVAKGHYGAVIGVGESEGAHTVEAGLRDRVFDGITVFEVDGVG